MNGLKVLNTFIVHQTPAGGSCQELCKLITNMRDYSVYELVRRATCPAGVLTAAALCPHGVRRPPPA